MGYYSKFEVSFLRKEDAVTEDQMKNCEKQLRELAKYNSEDNDIDEQEMPLVFQATWYDREQDLMDLTYRFRGIVIQVDCEGEDGELWRERYLNGEYETHDAILTYPEFDSQ